VCPFQCTVTAPLAGRLLFSVCKVTLELCDATPSAGMPEGALLKLAQRLRLAGGGGASPSGASPSGASPGDAPMSRALVTQALVNHFAERPSQLRQVNEMPLVPNEALLWDVNQVRLPVFPACFTSCPAFIISGDDSLLKY
jgi:hypothetical protein